MKILNEQVQPKKGPALATHTLLIMCLIILGARYCLMKIKSDTDFETNTSRDT